MKWYISVLLTFAAILIRISQGITEFANTNALVIASFTLSICGTVWTWWIYTFFIFSTCKVIRAIIVIAACNFS